MAEHVTLNASIDPPATVFRIALLALDWANAHIKIHVREWNSGTQTFGPRTVVVQYTGPVATTMMTALNKANLTTQSLHQRVITRLLADGKLPAGSAGGSVD
jgi:hypothetical protein